MDDLALSPDILIVELVNLADFACHFLCFEFSVQFLELLPDLGRSKSRLFFAERQGELDPLVIFLVLAAENRGIEFLAQVFGLLHDLHDFVPLQQILTLPQDCVFVLSYYFWAVATLVCYIWAIPRSFHPNISF